MRTEPINTPATLGFQGLTNIDDKIMKNSDPITMVNGMNPNQPKWLTSASIIPPRPLSQSQ